MDIASRIGNMCMELRQRLGALYPHLIGAAYGNRTHPLRLGRAVS